MSSTRLRLFPIVLLGTVLAGAASLPTPAAAGGWESRHRSYHGHGHFGFRHHDFRHRGYRHHRRSSVVLGLNFLVPLDRPSYYDPPVYYRRPPRVVYVDPPPVCRRFDGDATLDATGRRFFGTACLRPDGRWHIVN